MTDWKMPEDMREIWEAVGRQVLSTIALAKRFQKHNLLSTPTERDAQEKRIAKLKSALDNAEKENNAAWILNEKLKSGGQQKRIEALEAEVKRLIKAARMGMALANTFNEGDVYEEIAKLIGEIKETSK